MSSDKAYTEMKSDAQLGGDDEGSEYEDDVVDDDEEGYEDGVCAWKIQPTASLYDWSMMRILFVAQDRTHKVYANRPPHHHSAWRVFKILFLIFFNGALQLTVVSRVRNLVANTRAARVDNVFAPTGNCQRSLPENYLAVGRGRIGAKPLNWDCGPLWPLLLANPDFVDTNKDGYWSEADKPEETGDKYNEMFGKQGDLDRIYSEYVNDARKLNFETQINGKISAAQTKVDTADFTRIPMTWMKDQSNLTSLCNNVDPELCGALEVRDVLKEYLPRETTPIRRVRKCRDVWHWCALHFGELFRNYQETAGATCENVSPHWQKDAMVTINRYGRADKYSPRVNPQAILTPVYETFLLLVLLIWWLTVLSECRTVMGWWMALICINGGSVEVNRDVSGDEEKITVEAISGPVKAFLLILVVLPRTIIILALAYIGTDFLIIADSYGDLILNSVALGFLIEVDDMLFEGVSSEKDQNDISCLQTIEGKHTCNNCCTDFVMHNSSISLIICVTTIAVGMAYKAYVIPFGKVDLKGAYECLCHMEGAECVVAQLFGHKMGVPAWMLGVGDGGRGGKGGR